jgi:hypothetical protein
MFPSIDKLSAPAIMGIAQPYVCGEAVEKAYVEDGLSSGSDGIRSDEIRIPPCSAFWLAAAD